VSCWRHVISEEFLGEAGVGQRRAEVAGERLVRREGQVGVARTQRQVVRRRGQAMEAMQAVRPAAHNH
jgi:hypothetical protein